MSDRPVDNRPQRDGMMDALVEITAELAGLEVVDGTLIVWGDLHP